MAIALTNADPRPYVRTGLEGRTSDDLREIVASHPSHIWRILADKTLTARIDGRA